MGKNRVLIVVEGMAVQRVASDSDIEALVVDYDLELGGDSSYLYEQEVTVSQKVVNEEIVDAVNRSDKANRAARVNRRGARV